MKSYIDHWEKQYPGCKVIGGDASGHLECWQGDDFVHQLEKDGSGQWVDVSVKLGGKPVNFGSSAFDKPKKVEESKESDAQ